MRPVLLLVFIEVLLGLGGCAAPDAAPPQALALLLARERAARQAPPPEALRQPATLRAVLARPPAEVLPRLGGVDYTLSLSAEAQDLAGGPLARFEESRWLRVAPTGDFALVHHVDWAVPGDAEGRSGRRCAWRDGRYLVARRFGPATELAEGAAAAEACLATALEPLRALLDRVADELVIEGAGSVEIRGRRAERLVGRWVPRPARVPPAVPEAFAPGSKDSPAIYGPRGPLAVAHTDLRGASLSLILDGASGAPLEAELTLTLAFRKLGQDGRLRVSLRLASAAAAGAVQLPEGDRRAAPRPRPFAELAAWVEAAPAEEDAGLPAPGDESAQEAVAVERVDGARGVPPAGAGDGPAGSEDEEDAP